MLAEKASAPGDVQTGRVLCFNTKSESRRKSKKECLYQSFVCTASLTLLLNAFLRLFAYRPSSQPSKPYS